jgi:hypothetical protein
MLGASPESRRSCFSCGAAGAEDPDAPVLAPSAAPVGAVSDLEAGERYKAILTAVEIVFSDLSSVRWDGLTFEIGYRGLLRSSDETEAECFLAKRDAVARNAAGLN